MSEAVELLREIYDSKDELTALLVGWLLMLFVGLVLTAAFGQQTVDYGIGALGVAILLGSGWQCYRLFIRHLRVSAPVIAMDDVGIFDRRVSPTFFRWVDMLSIDEMRPSGHGLYRSLGSHLVLPIAQLTGSTFSSNRALAAWWAIRRVFGAQTFAVPIFATGTEATGEQIHTWCLAYSRTHKFEVDKDNV